MRSINFNAGPAGLPAAALERARDELLDYQGTGMSIMEHSHRGKAYEAVHGEATSLLRELLGLPEDREVLLLQGGASLQFAMLPMNLLEQGRSADYTLTGAWSKKAVQEAETVGNARVAASSADAEGRFRRMPEPDEVHVDERAAYLHLTSNETIEGTEWWRFPDPGDVPLVADMSSDILGRRIEAERFAVIYAGAQKNLGPSGVTVVAIRRDLVERGRRDIPKVLQYRTHADADSLYNTPPTFGVYLLRNVLSWLQEHGGVEAIEALNRTKAGLVYGVLDRLSEFYTAPVETASRSLMNIVFRLPSEELEARFVAEAAAEGMVGLKGHRSVGGIRASTYNAVSVEDCAALASFMERFAGAAG